MTTRWLLDTSALLALWDDEDGAERWPSCSRQPEAAKAAAWSAS